MQKVPPSRAHPRKSLIAPIKFSERKPTTKNTMKIVTGILLASTLLPELTFGHKAQTSALRQRELEEYEEYMNENYDHYNNAEDADEDAAGDVNDVNENSYGADANEMKDYYAIQTDDDWIYYNYTLDETTHYFADHLEMHTCMRKKTGQYDADNYIYTYGNYLELHFCDGRKSWRERGDCDGSVNYVIGIEDYFRSTAGCVANYCDRCDATCGNANATTLESVVNGLYCNRCTKSCELYERAAALTEEEYTGCSPVNGTNYYYGVACSKMGTVSKDFFYDEECTAKIENNNILKGLPRPRSNKALSFDVFKMVNSFCMNCENGGVCENITDSSYHCSPGGTLLNSTLIAQDDKDERSHHSRDSGNSGSSLCAYTLAAPKNIETERARLEKQRKYAIQHAISVVKTTFWVVMGLSFSLFVFVIASYLYYGRHNANMWGNTSICGPEDDAEENTTQYSAVEEDDRVLP